MKAEAVMQVREAGQAQILQGDAIDVLRTLRCASCMRWLPADSFYRKGQHRHSYCKPCHHDRTMVLRGVKRSAEVAT